MKLYGTPRSPFVRKVRVMMIETGLDRSIEFVEVNLEHPPAALLEHNPLGKVPTLVRDDGSAIFDSPFVCEYLDSRHAGPKLFPAAGEARWNALRLLTLCDGILDAFQTRRHEAKRPSSLQSSEVMTHQREKSDAGLAALEAAADELGGSLNIGIIAAGCCLGYADFRFAPEPWRPKYPRLATWYQAFSTRPSMQRTVPPAGGH